MTKLGRHPKSKAQQEATRAKIVASALKLFQEEGFASVSIRRLAKEAGCAPMTIYAHFDAKINILQHLWTVVLEAVSASILLGLQSVPTPRERISVAAHTFVQYWLDNPDHFRLVFMSGDVSRPDVGTFVQNPVTLAHFAFFEGLVEGALPSGGQAKAKTDALINALIGVAFCANTISDYPWTDEKNMIDLLVTGVLSV